MQPLVERLPFFPEGPAAWEALEGGAASYFLDSGMDHRKLGRYSFIGADPFLLFSSRGERCCLHEPGAGTRRISGNPFTVLREAARPYLRPPAAPEIPPMAGGGAVGYFGYDLGRMVERLPRFCVDDLGLPECWFGFYDGGVVLDHVQKEAYLVSTGLPLAGAAGERRARERLQAWRRRLQTAAPGAAGAEARRPRYRGRDLVSNFTRNEYLKAVEKALAYIAAGDIYQVNLSQRFSATLQADPWELYLRLRHLNPAPFAAFLRFPGLAIASSSPERFLKVEGRRVETRPIKGTRPRGRTAEEDRRLRDELLYSAKDRAELVMIVDLERNDLGRVCRPGTVQVPELFSLETYATVYHLVATVTGELEPGRDIFDLLPAAFPGGSITGAPKIRSMEIIEELEPVRRHVYTGSLGYIDFRGKSDLNIVIRTFIVREGRAYFQVGGGIVADSCPDLEYQETLDKARALFGALGLKEAES